MNNYNNKSNDNDSKKITFAVVAVLVLMLAVTSSTYAWFAVNATNNNVITGTASNASLELTVTKNAPTKTNTGVMVPQLETYLGTAMNSSNGCVDSNNNIVCQVYTITVKNTSNATVTLDGTITFGNSSTLPNLKWRKTTNATTLGSYTTNAANVSTAQTLDTAKQLARNATETYTIVVWINEINSAQSDTGTYTATIAFTGSDGRGITSTIRSNT